MLIAIFNVIGNKFARVALAALVILCIAGGIIFIPTLNRQWQEITALNNNMIPLDTDASQGRSWGGGAIRIAIWQSTKELRNSHWLAGVGTGDIQDSLQQAYRNHQFYFASEYNRYNSHNQYLQNLLGQGILSLAALIASIIIPFFFLKIIPFRTSYLLFLALFAIMCLTEVILNTSKGVVWYSFFNSIFAFSRFNLSSINNAGTYARE